MLLGRQRRQRDDRRRQTRVVPMRLGGMIVNIVQSLRGGLGRRECANVKQLAESDLRLCRVMNP